ncbi:BsaA family SipW-dependent biofilm matrix protein [Clostridium sp.]|uniref:BsaA family SipW-dependent biofilm matrix protein n=1 Tax=Clostridium sp. TaxID=1506 RepID=UPI003F2CDBCD
MRKRSKPKRKRYILICTLLISAILVSVDSFAWFKTEVSMLNIFKTSKLEVRVAEYFVPPEDMRLGETVKKMVTVENTGGASALVRISLDEYLALFEIDSNTGNLLTIDDDGSEKLDMKDPNSWAVGQLNRDRLDGKKYNKIKEIRKESNIGIKSSIEYLDISFTNLDDDWIYDENTRYFYYTKILKQKEISTVLLDKVTLSNSLPNSHKGMKYDLVVNMDAIEATKDALIDTWGTVDNELLDRLTTLFD